MRVEGGGGKLMNILFDEYEISIAQRTFIANSVSLCADRRPPSSPLSLSRLHLRPLPLPMAFVFGRTAPNYRFQISCSAHTKIPRIGNLIRSRTFARATLHIVCTSNSGSTLHLLRLTAKLLLCHSFICAGPMCARCSTHCARNGLRARGNH